MTAIDPKYIAKSNFDNAIKTCQKSVDKFKGSERQKKYVLMLNELKSAKQKLDDAIEKTKSITMKDGKTFYESFVEGNESAVTLAWLGDKINNERSKGEVTTDQAVDVSTNEVDVHYDFVDRTKKAGKDLFDGKGIAKGLVNATIGVMVGELLTKGVTSLLVKNGVMSEAMGLVGLGKMGIANLPRLLPALKTGALAVWNFSPIIGVAIPALIALKAVPMVKHFVDKTKSKVKEASQFENNINEMVSKQGSLAI